MFDRQINKQFSSKANASLFSWYSKITLVEKDFGDGKIGVCAGVCACVCECVCARGRPERMRDVKIVTWERGLHDCGSILS